MNHLYKIILILLFLGLTMISTLSPNDKIVTIFAHGLGGDATQGRYYHVDSNEQYSFIQTALITFNFKDAGNPFLSCLGQEADTACLHEICKKYTCAILVGCSRGAATIANYLATYQPKNIVAAILESPFDQVSNVIKPRPGLENLELIAPSMYPNYKPNGLQPIKVAERIPHNIPILIVASKQDSLIPYTSTENLYNKIVASGHKKAHLLITKKGAHANILFEKNGYIFRDAVHAFFKEYDLPYHQSWALEGQNFLNDAKQA